MAMKEDPSFPLDACLQDTLLPGHPWQRLLEKLLSHNVISGNSPDLPKLGNERKEIFLDTLGHEYCSRYYPDELSGLSAISRIPSERLRRLKHDLICREYNGLKQTLAEFSSKSDQPKPMKSKKEGRHLKASGKEFQDALGETKDVFSDALHRQLYLQENELKRDSKADFSAVGSGDNLEDGFLLEVLEKEDKNLLLSDFDLIAPNPQKVGTFESDNTLKLPVDTAANALSLPAYLKPEKLSSLAVRSSVLPEEPSMKVYSSDFRAPRPDRGEDDPPLFWCPQSDLLGDYLVNLLTKESSRLEKVLDRLKGHQLPSSLRRYVWMMSLLRAEVESLKVGSAGRLDVEKRVRENFAVQVARGRSLLKIKHATSCPIENLIERHVIKTFHEIPSMRRLASQDLLSEAVRTLNVCYTQTRTFQTQKEVCLLFPLQLAYPSARKEDEQQPYKLAMRLSLLLEGCFPNVEQINVTAQDVLRNLRHSDPELCGHIIKIFEFREVMPEKARDILHSPVGEFPHQNFEQSPHESGDNPQKSKDKAKPSGQSGGREISSVICAWIKDGFVAVLDTQALLFAWDQFMMTNWEHKTLRHMCLTLVLLLKQKIMTCDENRELLRILYEEPSRLYTKDIIDAFNGLRHGEKANLVGKVNKQRLETPQNVAPVGEVQTSRPEYLPSLGVTDIYLCLHFGRSSLFAQEGWLCGFDAQHASSFRIVASLFFGSVQLASLHPDRGFELKSIDHAEYGPPVITLHFNGELFFLKNDISKLDVEKEIGGHPFLVLSFFYSHFKEDGGREPLVPIGWSVLDVFGTPNPQEEPRSSSIPNVVGEVLNARRAKGEEEEGTRTPRSLFEKIQEKMRRKKSKKKASGQDFLTNEWLCQEGVYRTLVHPGPLNEGQTPHDMYPLSPVPDLTEEAHYRDVITLKSELDLQVFRAYPAPEQRLSAPWTRNA